MIDDEEYERAQSAGVPDEQVTAWIDVVEHLDIKLAALRAHRSQIPDDWFFLQVPDELKPKVLGNEAYVRVFCQVDAPDRETDLFAGIR